MSSYRTQSAANKVMQDGTSSTGMKRPVDEVVDSALPTPPPAKKCGGGKKVFFHSLSLTL